MRQAPAEAQHDEEEDGDAGPLVPRIELELLRRQRQFVHVEAEREGGDEGEGDQPVQADGDMV
jgi:hypothetical protein